MEIERKYLIHKLPDHLEAYPHRTLEQAYLCTEPVVRVRRDADDYILTYKSKGLMMREEHNLPLTEEAYCHLREKAEVFLPGGRLIFKIGKNGHVIVSGPAEVSFFGELPEEAAKP